MAAGCRTAGIGCIDCKKNLLVHLAPAITPIGEKIQSSMKKPAELRDILDDGAKRATAAAAETMAIVREKIFSEKAITGKLEPV